MRSLPFLFVVVCCFCSVALVAGNGEVETTGDDCECTACSACMNNCGGGCAQTSCGSSCGGSSCSSSCASSCVQRCSRPCRTCQSSCRQTSCPPQQQVPPVQPPTTTLIRFVDGNGTGGGSSAPSSSGSSAQHSIHTPVSAQNDIANNVTTHFDMTMEVSNNNTIHIPITHTYNHATNISIAPPPQPIISINISNTNPVSHLSSSPNYNTQHTATNSCCTMVPPKECHYEKNAQINCTQVPQKVCGPMCTSPLVMQHPYPVYIDRVRNVPVPVPVPQPVPVPVPQPYPVHYVQRVPVPVGVPQPYPVPQYVPYVQRVPVQLPCPPQPPPVYIDRQQIVPMPIPTYCPPPPPPPPQTVNLELYQQYNQLWQMLQQMRQQQQVVQVQQPVQTQTIHHFVPQAQQCPISIWNGAQYPVCKTVTDAQKFIGTKNTFLIDQFIGSNQFKEDTFCKPIAQYPWINCYKQNMQDCRNCVFCDGKFNPGRCMYSPTCSYECQRTMLDLKLTETMDRTLNCQFINAALRCT